MPGTTVHGLKQGADNADWPTTSFRMPRHKRTFDDTRAQREHLEPTPMSRTQRQLNFITLYPRCT